jgi:hypothetical protein
LSPLLLLVDIPLLLEEYDGVHSLYKIAEDDNEIRPLINVSSPSPLLVE